MFSVCMCARFQASPREVQLKAAKRILRYLKHTPNIGIWYPKGAQFELIGYSDSDYAGCKVDRKKHIRMLSISWKVYCFMVIQVTKFSCSIHR
jgi:hypothetical protein